MSINIEMNMKGADGTYEQLYPRTLGDLVQGKVAQSTSADTATQAEKANEATRASTATTAGSLTTARSLRTNLATTSSQSFDGSANATSIGVNGTLGVSNGGTGVTSYSSLATQLSSYLSGAQIETGSRNGTGTYSGTLFYLYFSKLPKILWITEYKQLNYDAITRVATNNSLYMSINYNHSMMLFNLTNGENYFALSSYYNGSNDVYVKMSAYANNGTITVKVVQNPYVSQSGIHAADDGVDVLNQSGTTYYYGAIM